MELTPSLEAIAPFEDELKEALAPGEVNTCRQRSWLIWQRQADLDHELSMVAHWLDERLATRDALDTR